MFPLTNSLARLPCAQMYQDMMIEDRIKNIRLQIESISETDKKSGALEALLQARIPALHGAIRLPAQNAPPLLADFVMRYINHVPDFIEAIVSIAKDAQIEENISPLLRIATDYFLQPPELINNHQTCEALLHESYLAHRLLEEINDRFIGLCGVPLAPMDMTRANLITHEIIGEPLANDLDQAVLFSAELLLNEHLFSGSAFDQFIALHQSNNWSLEHSRWPCLAEDLAIKIRFNDP